MPFVTCIFKKYRHTAHRKISLLREAIAFLLLNNSYLQQRIPILLTERLGIFIEEKDDWILCKIQNIRREKKRNNEYFL